LFVEKGLDTGKKQDKEYQLENMKETCEKIQHDDGRKLDYEHIENEGKFMEMD
jgi:hypothetical protein